MKSYEPLKRKVAKKNFNFVYLVLFAGFFNKIEMAPTAPGY
jgi:hypothetical protein